MTEEPYIPYGRQIVDQADIDAVVEVLRSDWLTTGPAVAAFEEAFAVFAGTSHAAAVSTGTAALHCALAAAGVGPGDEVIVPAMTFAATANAALYLGARPVFADVDPTTLLLDPDPAESLVTDRTRAMIAVDYAGQPCEYKRLRSIADRHGLILIDDACHALGGTLDGRPVGSLADLSCFSFHPVKHMTTGEGGMVTTSSRDFAARVKTFRNHGITADFRQREQACSWEYDMVELGNNYRLSDINAALGRSQLGKVPGWIARRQELAARYRSAFSGIPAVKPLAVRKEVSHAYHLFMVRIDAGISAMDRATVFAGMRARRIGVNVHYRPVYLHPYYMNHHGTSAGLCPRAEEAYTELLSLPMYAGLSNSDQDRVIEVLAGLVGA